MISFHLKKDTNIEIVWALLEELGFTPLYSTRDEKGREEIIIEGDVLEELPCLDNLDKPRLLDPVIDWDWQWAAHAKNFNDGYLHFSLKEDRQIKLKPGPGFGDLSHPSTELTLDLILHHIDHRFPLIDLGCGSGILGIVAAALGVQPIWAIDMDPQALQHAKHNAELNHLNAIQFYLPHDFKMKEKTEVTLAMNMILTEQKIAISNLPSLQISHAFTSGILVEQEKEYLALTSSWGWEVQNTQEKDGWLGFHFSLNP